MLDDVERRALDDIEGRLAAEDPRWVLAFDAQQARLPTDRPPWMHHLLVGGAVLMGTLALIMLVAGIPSLTALFALSAAGFVWIVHRPSRSDGSRITETPRDPG
ncbi:DUF3040 domain-containing protein [Actinomycetospora lutea]|uniref:DUF3040 domain-containing protein n=1 Tax=Actinomycetospora lutea TaxID=663604 RepID=UPI0023664C61|nr:DUF3040 domain-containing protein [Actinomycetospora lutea]MDD7939512.1 DUF3040 domain-containing protein [Actinomycetospora lutea]